MTDQEHFASRFSVEVDRILEREKRAEAEGPPLEYAEMLALGERLAALDFSNDSQLRHPLRRRLLNRLKSESSTAQRRNSRLRRVILPRSRRALGVLAALTALVLLVGWTPAGRAVAQAVEQFVLELRWPHTTVQQLSSGVQPTHTPEGSEWLETQQADGYGWAFKFEGYDFGSCCYSELARDEVVPLPQAIDEAGFDVKLPGFLPDGYLLSEVRLLGVPPHDVFVIYDGRDGRLGLYQFPVGLVSEERAGENIAILERRAVGVLTDGTLEEALVGTSSAALINGERLVWEEKNISFHLIGPGLDTAILVQVAESLTLAR